MGTTTKYEVTEIKWSEKTFIAKRATMAFDDLPAFFGESYGAIYGFIQQHGLHSADMPCAIYYSIDEHKKETDLAAAVPVEGIIPETEEFEKNYSDPFQSSVKFASYKFDTGQKESVVLYLC